MATATVGPTSTQQINADFYVGVSALHTIQAAVDAAVAQVPAYVIIPPDYAGDDEIADVTNGSADVPIEDRRGPNPLYYAWDGEEYTGPSFITDQLTATDASFDACEVDNSPVRTFANTSDGGGPSYPPAGIGVSTGQAWEPDSIDPATLVLQDAEGDATVAGLLAARTTAGIGVNMGGTNDYPAIGFTNPTAATDEKNTLLSVFPGGVQLQFVSDDEQTINPALLLNRSGATPAFATINGNLTVNGDVSIPGAGGIGTLSIGGAGGAGNIGRIFLNGSQVVAGSDNSIHLNPNGGVVMLNWDTGTGVWFGDGEGNRVGILDTIGNLSVNGAVVAHGATPNINSAVSSVAIGTGGGGDNPLPLITFANSAAPLDQKASFWLYDNNGAHYYLQNDAGNATAPQIEFLRSGITPTVVNIAGNLSVSGSIFGGANTVTVTTLNVVVQLPGTQALYGLLRIRDSTLGGSALYLVDPNFGTELIGTSQIPGLSVGIDSANAYVMQVGLSSGPVPRQLNWTLYN